MDEQLNQIAEQTGVPADLLERAARARAAAQGVAAEALVAGWAGGDAPAPEAAPTPTPTPAAAPPAEPVVEAPAPAVAESGGGSVPAAESEGGKQLPEALLRRSAEARAKREGRSVEEVLAEMTGGGEPAAPAPAAASAPAAESGGGKQLPEALLRRSAAAKAKREGRPLDEVLVEMGLNPDGATSEAPAAKPAGAPAPVAETTASDSGEAQPEAAAAVVDAGPEPIFAGFPRWLAASFIIIPLFALLYAGFAPNGPDCGTSGQLAINPISGEAESCGGPGSVYFSIGQSIYTGQCAACHSADGSGGVGPALAGGAVLQTFSACTDQIQWVTLGSNNWPDATYGDTNRPVLGTGVAMPGYDGNLSAEEIASVVLYERVSFGGADPITEEAACGLGVPAAAGG